MLLHAYDNQQYF